MLGWPVISFMASGHGLLWPSFMVSLGEEAEKGNLTRNHRDPLAQSGILSPYPVSQHKGSSRIGRARVGLRLGWRGEASGPRDSSFLLKVTMSRAEQVLLGCSLPKKPNRKCSQNRSVVSQGQRGFKDTHARSFPASLDW